MNYEIEEEQLETVRQKGGLIIQFINNPSEQAQLEVVK